MSRYRHAVTIRKVDLLTRLALTVVPLRDRDAADFRLLRETHGRVLLEIDRTLGDKGTFPEDDIRADLDGDGKWFFSRKDGARYWSDVIEFSSGETAVR